MQIHNLYDQGTFWTRLMCIPVIDKTFLNHFDIYYCSISVWLPLAIVSFISDFEAAYAMQKTLCSEILLYEPENGSAVPCFISVFCLE